MSNVYGKPGPNSIWTTTALGDVYVFDPAIAEVKQTRLYITLVNHKIFYVTPVLLHILCRNVNYLKTGMYKKWMLLVKIYRLKAYYKMVLDMVVL